MANKEQTDIEITEEEYENRYPKCQIEENVSECRATDRQKSPSYKFKKDKSLWLKYKVPLFGEIRFNPIVSLLAIALIWTFVIICIYFKNLPFKAWRTWIVDAFTWLYIGSQDAWAVFAIVLYCSKYSKIKLGKDSDVPMYSDTTWFMMLFACGIGTGLFFYGVAEPIYHYAKGNRYASDPTLPDNTLAQIAINITWYHWGIHGWIVYSLVGLLLGLLSYREGLPMTMKSCFYPLIGDRIFGWMGDLIDVVSIITTLFGVCTSLGLGTRQLNTGLNMVNSDIPLDNITVQIIIIWCITAVATVSTVSGVGMGIRRLSETCFGVGMFLMIVSLFMDKTFFILNLYVQSFGYYIQNILQLGFHTDTWEQLSPSYGAEDRGRWVPDGVESTDGPPQWMDWWTMFYWGWWISWCPFVGMFIAKISKGRTIKQFINGTLTAPVIYSFIWLTIFGGAGIRTEREAAGVGLCCPTSEGWFQANLSVSSFSGRVDENDIIVPESSYFLCENGSCGTCADAILKLKKENNVTYMEMLDEYIYLGNDFGSVSKDRKYARISCHQDEQMWFDLMRSYGDLGHFLAGFSLLGIVLYFVTSSDSGSLVIDCLSSNGDPDPPRIQRVFWALMEGATATALLVAGGKDGLIALQTAGLLSGLPYTFLVCLICVSIWRAVKVANGDLDPEGPTFAIGIFDAFFTQPYNELKHHCRENMKLFGRFVINIAMAPITAAKVNRRLNNSKGTWFFTAASICTFSLCILFHILEIVISGAWAIAWFWYICFTTLLTSLRLSVRNKYRIDGNVSEDFFCSLLLYPCCALQIDLTTEDWVKDDSTKKNKTDPEDITMNENRQNGVEGHDNKVYISSE